MTFMFESETDIPWEFDHVKLFGEAAECVLSEEGCPFECEVSLLLTDDENIRQINKDSRGIDKATDVLSFPMIEYDQPSDFSHADDITSKDPETGDVYLGDIVLSADHVVSQADLYGHDVQREFAFLIVHSMLHLCGYDHETDNERMRMEERQKIIMEKLSASNPFLAV